MKNTKEYYEDLQKSKDLNGFEWWVFIEGVHYFNKREGRGFVEVCCSEEQIDNGDIEFMCAKGLTLSYKIVKKINKEYIKNN